MNLQKGILIIAIVVFMFSFIFADSPNSNGIRVTNMSLIRKGTVHQFLKTTTGDFDLNIDCTEDTGSVDIVFVLDTTGSMSSHISDARTHIVEFAESMAVTGYDYSLGIITYGDDFNFPHGCDLISDVDTFSDWMGAIGSSGGADIPETALDAIMGAVDSIHWRTGALKVIIILTDACFCEVGAGCADCHSIWTADEVATTLLDNGFMFFAATRSPISTGSCCSAATAMWLYQDIADSTGGSWFNLSESFASIYSDIIGLLGTFQVIQVDVANNSGADLDSIFAYITAGSCIDIIYGDNPELRLELLDGDTISFFWRVNYTAGCMGPDGCFNIALSSADGSYSDFQAGCMYIPHCWCTPVVAGLISPEMGVWSACNPQPISVGIYDEDGVDTSTIQFIVQSDTVTYPDPGLIFDDGMLTYTPDTNAFASGDSIVYKLIDVRDAVGCTLSSPVSGWFLVDLDPPQFENEIPDSGCVVGGIPTDIAIVITDEYAGLDTGSLILIIENTDTYFLDDPLVSLNGDTLSFNPVGTYDWEAGETVSVCVYAADLVSDHYCGPNGDQYCWDFIVDRLHLFFIDTTVDAGDDILYPIFADDPGRFGFTTYEMWVRYNPMVVSVESLTTSGTASAGFTLDWTDDSGIIHITASNSSPIGLSSFFLNLHLHIIDNVSGGAFTSFMISDAVFDSGRVGYWSDDGMIIVNWIQTQWVHDLIFYGYDGAGGYLFPTNLAIGCGYGASTGYDPAYDLIIPIPPPSQTESYIELNDPDYPAINRLSRSIQNSYELPVTWYIATIEEAGSLYWSPHYFPSGVFTLNGYIDMKRDSVYHYAANETLVIVYSQPDIGGGDISGCLGWNLMSLPITITIPGWTAGIDGIIAGPLEYDASIRRYINEDPPRMGFGFWLFAINPFATDIAGTPLDEVSIPIYRGWNLIGSVSDTATYDTEPSGIAMSGSLFKWDCVAQAFVPATSIDPGNGYWIFCTGDGILHIHP